MAAGMTKTQLVRHLAEKLGYRGTPSIAAALRERPAPPEGLETQPAAHPASAGERTPAVQDVPKDQEE